MLPSLTCTPSLRTRSVLMGLGWALLSPDEFEEGGHSGPAPPRRSSNWASVSMVGLRSRPDRAALWVRCSTLLCPFGLSRPVQCRLWAACSLLQVCPIWSSMTSPRCAALAPRPHQLRRRERWRKLLWGADVPPLPFPPWRS
jgi:hypothetical protein